MCLPLSTSAGGTCAELVAVVHVRRHGIPGHLLRLRVFVIAWRPMADGDLIGRGKRVREGRCRGDKSQRNKDGFVHGFAWLLDVIRGNAGVIVGERGIAANKRAMYFSIPSGYIDR